MGKVYFIRRNGLPEANASTRNKRNVFKRRAMELYPVIAFLKGIDAMDMRHKFYKIVCHNSCARLTMTHVKPIACLKTTSRLHGETF